MYSYYVFAFHLPHWIFVTSILKSRIYFCATAKAAAEGIDESSPAAAAAAAAKTLRLGECQQTCRYCEVSSRDTAGRSQADAEATAAAAAPATKQSPEQYGGFGFLSTHGVDWC